MYYTPVKFTLWSEMLLIAMITFNLHATSQETPTGFRHFTTENGLPSNNLYHTMQDTKGYIWIATQNGVSRYDGYEFENFTTSNGLMDNCTFLCLEDNKHRIWFVGLSPELCYYSYDDNKIHPYKYNDNITRLNLKKHFRLSMVVDGDEVYVGNWIDGYYHIDSIGNARKVSKPAGLSLLILKKGCLIYEVNEPEKHSLPSSLPACGSKPQYIYINKKPYYFGYPQIMGFQEFFRTEKNIYLRYGKAIWVAGTDSFNLVRKESDQIGEITEDRRGNIHVSYSHGDEGYRTYRQIWNQDELPVRCLKGVQIQKFQLDKEGNLWLSTNKGLYHRPLNDHVLATFVASNGLPREVIRRIQLANDQVAYVQYENSEILELVEKSRQVRKLLTNAKNAVYATPFHFDKYNKRILAQSDLNKIFSSAYKTTFGVVPSFRVNIQSLVPGNHDDLWMALENGIYHLEGDRITDVINRETKRSGNSNGIIDQFYVNAMLSDNNGVLFVGSPITGFYTYDGKQMIFAAEEYGHLYDNVVDIERFDDRTLLLANIGSGITIQRADTVYALTTEAGLSSDMVESLVVDKEGTIWAGTHNGLNRIVVSGGSFAVTQVLGKLQGLPSNRIEILALKNNHLWVGTDNGLCVLDIRKVKPNTSPPFLEFTGLKIFETDTTLLPSYSFHYDQNYLTFQYTGIAYKHQGTMEYEYMLEGLEDSWQRTKLREVRYNSLPSGEYRFSVIAYNEDKTPSRKASIAFTILPPYWETWWFRTGIVLTIAISIYFFIRWRISMIKEKATIHREKVELQLKALRAQMNPHFTFNTLNTIQDFILRNDHVNASDYLSRLSKLMRLILEHSRHSKITLMEEMETLRLYLDLEKLGFDGRMDYRIDIAQGLKPGDVEVPPMLIQPYVENAIVHGLSHKEEDDGLVEISLRKEEHRLEPFNEHQEGYICCLIRDNGIGREAAAKVNLSRNRKRDSLGTEIMRERLDIIGKEEKRHFKITVNDLHDKDGKAAGTEVEILIPL